MVIDLFFLIVLDMPAHDNDGLTHEEHEKAADKGQDQESDAADGHLRPKGRMGRVHCTDKFLHQDIVVGRIFFILYGLADGPGGCVSRLAGLYDPELFFHGIDHKAGHLGSENAEIVGKYDEYQAP